jgi:hypothetical protein
VVNVTDPYGRILGFLNRTEHIITEQDKTEQKRTVNRTRTDMAHENRIEPLPASCYFNTWPAYRHVPLQCLLAYNRNTLRCGPEDESLHERTRHNSSIWNRTEQTMPTIASSVFRTETVLSGKRDFVTAH